MDVTTAAFTSMLVEANGLEPNTFQGWAFFPGMLFNSKDKWWGDYGFRKLSHEGVDFCLYQDPSGQVRQLGTGTRIPVMHDGRVRALFDDYLGQAVIIEHAGVAGHSRFLSVYAHTQPQKGVAPGVAVRTGDIIATIADTRWSKANIRPHLHISMGYPSPQMVYDPFIWERMHDPDQMELIDPLPVVDWPHRVLASPDQNNPCLFETTRPTVI